METVLLDFNVVLFSVLIAIIIFSLYFLSLNVLKFDNSLFQIEGFAVIELIRTLKKICPVQTCNKWRLLTSKWSNCFSKSTFLPGFKSCLKIYGATCAVSCSSMYAFSLISDVSKWGEWEPCVSRGLVQDPVRTDRFMQASPIVSIQKGADVQSYTAFYQFVSFPSKCTKWILYWNAKQFEFMFFLLQPAVSKNSDSHCVITHLYCSNHLHTVTTVAQRLRNIKEFLNLSQLNIRPLRSSLLPSSKEGDLLKTPSTPQPDDNKGQAPPNLIFTLVPLFFRFAARRLKGYNLVLKKMTETSQSEKLAVNDAAPKKAAGHDVLRRSASDMNIVSKEKKNLRRVTSCQLPASELNASSTVPDDMEAIEEGGEEEECELPSEIKKRSLSEPCIEKSLSDFIDRDLDMKSLPSIRETEESVYDCTDKNELFCSSTSEFEILDSNQQFIDSRKADYLTQGNYGASVLQTEMMLASQYDRTQSIGNRVAGGWIHSSTHKGIPVLSKCINMKVMKIYSFLCQTEIPVNYKDVWKCVKNPRFRFMSDETVKTVQIVDRISESQRLIHVYHEVSGILKKEAIDFCLLQTEREEKEEIFYSVFQSIEYERCPFMAAVVRGTLKPSGWIVQNLTPKSCRITYLVQILVNSPDNSFIQELSSLVPQSVYNLRHYIASSPWKGR